MEPKKITYGLLLRQYERHGFKNLVAELVQREGDHHAPRNVSVINEYELPKHLSGMRISDLMLEGFLSSGSAPHKLIGFEPAFYNVYKVEERDGVRMAKTLKRLGDAIRKDEARTPVDVFSAVCAALRLSFVVECRDQPARSSYDDNRWRWMSIGEGRNRYRQLVEDMERAADEADRPATLDEIHAILKSN